MKYDELYTCFVAVSSRIISDESGVAVQRFCDQWLYLGVMVDSDGGIEEIDEDNNHAWAPVFLTCPGITGNNISSRDRFYIIIITSLHSVLLLHVYNLLFLKII